MRILGVDIGGTSIKICMSNEHGKIETFEEYPSHAKQGASFLLKRVIETIERFSNISAIGISTAGQVNNQDGSILYANENIPGYTGIKLKTIMEEHFQVPVNVQNDVHAAAIGEMYFGNGQEYDDFLCLTYGTGIGGAIIIDKSLYNGEKGIAAEFGHIMTHPHGEKCNCGRFGCYEMYASTTALVASARQINEIYDNGRTIYSDYEKGIKEITDVVDAWTDEVVTGLVTLVHVFNPPAIIVGGGIMEQQKIVQNIQTKLKQEVMQSFADVKLIQAKLGNKAGALGAVSSHLQTFHK